MTPAEALAALDAAKARRAATEAAIAELQALDRSIHDRIG